MSLRFLCVLALLCASLAGCSSASQLPAPTTHPVRGKITQRNGQPVSGGMVEFQSTTASSLNARSECGPDGTFQLEVMNADGEKFPGAEPGQYRVTYYPVMSAAQTEVPIDLPKIVTVEPKDNEVTLQLP